MSDDNVTFKFIFQIDAKQAAQTSGDLHRLYELVAAFINFHCHKGFHLVNSEYTNRAL